ncbi:MULTISPECIES: hypothetical protein [unclassified Clostridium]|uniref:hypothetical protein n=1 Tax=unclassified Clostridium TaxID=2614128 RepID=UPI0025C58608|nr:MULTISPECIES: hypothetical protein [unclassified Clostridium]
MYKDLDNFLYEETTINSWYNDGFLIAQDMLTQFSSEDWEELSKNILSKPLEWQKKLIYCLDNDINENELNIIAKMLTINDQELFDICIDSLRSFNNEIGKAFVLSNPSFIKLVKERIPYAGAATQKILQDFLDKFCL